MLTTNANPALVDRQRYRRVNRYFIGLFLHLVWWDVVLNQPGLRGLRRPPAPRWRTLARQYRELAVEMGGLLIKLGQFLSIRVDFLPAEVIDELRQLQDAVPPVPFPQLRALIETEIGSPVEQRFAWLSPQPLGAASIAQAHLARLHSGEQVVVKVLRPGIDTLINTDLAVVRRAVGRFRQTRRGRQRLDLGRMIDEFVAVTQQEIDLVREGRSAERMAQDFANDPQLGIPKIYWDYSTPRMLTMEYVAYIKVNDGEALDRAGIRRGAVATMLYRVFLRQFFETGFVHADPHPGNVFVKPLPVESERQAGVAGFLPGEVVPQQPDRPFQLILIDFGMAVEIPPRLRSSLREYGIGVGLRSARRIVKSYVLGGLVPPDADLRRLEEATEAILGNFGESLVGMLGNVDSDKMRAFNTNYGDITRETPFQVQSELLFMYRAMGILSGIATDLDPDFDLWSAAEPLARQMIQDELRKNWREWLAEIVAFTQQVVGLSGRIDHLVGHMQRGDLTVQMALAPDTRRAATRLDGAIRRLTWAVVGSGMLIAGAAWHIGDTIVAALSPQAVPRPDVGLWLAGLALVTLVVGLLRGGR